MPSTSLAVLAQPLSPISPSCDFDFDGLAIFRHIPDNDDFGIAALHGFAVIYDQSPLCREGIIAGSLYVRESQQPEACMSWDRWLEEELRDRAPRRQPPGRLKTRRQVVQAIRWRDGEHWAVRLASGAIDGPYCDWAFGTDLVGKVVGVYRPT